MLTEIGSNSKVTIPSEIIKDLGICTGDKFEIIEKDGGIFLLPVVVYPQETVDKINQILKDSEEELKNQKPYDSVEKMFSDMGIDISDV